MSSEVCAVRVHQLQRFELGEDLALGAHVASCASCTARLASLAADRAAFFEANDPAIASAQILAKLEAAPAKRWSWAWLPAALAMMIAFVFALDPPSEDRVKGGGPSLSMFVNRPDGPALAEPGTSLRPGEQVQFRYAAAGHRYLQVVSVDGRGAITLLFPAGGAASASVEPHGVHALPESTILDDAIGPERVFALFSDAPLSFEDVEATLAVALSDAGGDVRALEGVPLEAVDQASVWFLKVP